jgi:hypothetical protein
MSDIELIKKLRAALDEIERESPRAAEALRIIVDLHCDEDLYCESCRGEAAWLRPCAMVRTIARALGMEP